MEKGTEFCRNHNTKIVNLENNNRLFCGTISFFFFFLNKKHFLEIRANNEKRKEKKKEGNCTNQVLVTNEKKKMSHPTASTPGLLCVIRANWNYCTLRCNNSKLPFSQQRCS